MRDFIKRFDYRHYICFVITAFFIFMFQLFPNSAGRLIEAVRDFGLSVAYYVVRVFHIPGNVDPLVTELSGYKVTVFLPFEWEEFKALWSRYWEVWASWSNVSEYLAYVGRALAEFSKFLVVILPFLIVLYIVFVNNFYKQNNDYNFESKPLRCFKWLTAHSYMPIKKWLVSFFTFLKEHKSYFVAWLLLWLLYFNIYTIAFEFLAFYYYFIVDFDFTDIYLQLYKLLCDIATPATFIPLVGWAVVGYVLFDRIRKKIAYRVLNHNEMKNRGFINERPIVFMVCGTMGKKKTTIITDMALSQEVMFRDKALDMLIENDLKFPDFPWINIENCLKKAIDRHEVYNLATCRKFVRRLIAFYELSQTVSDEKIRRKINKHYLKFFGVFYDNYLFDYDYLRFGLFYDDKLKIENIWTVIETYCQLYFVYVMQSSLILSNYSIRTDNVFSDVGNFPLWNTDFFKRDSRVVDEVSRHSHILDFDTLRLGLRVVEDNVNADNFEFGIINITEIGKERGNVIELADKIKKAETANQKNDLFNSWLKMVRHSATINNYPFVRVITDEQRPESWGLDARALCEIVSIKQADEIKLAMPFFTFGSMFYDFIFSKFLNLYLQYRYNRGDNTLIMYLLKNFTAFVVRRYSRIYNLFGYCPMDIQIESGTQDGVVVDKNYYLSSKKIYSKRFSTDCFSDFFSEKALRSSVGLDDIAEYATEKASLPELELQNSYFVRDLVRTFKKK